MGIFFAPYSLVCVVKRIQHSVEKLLLLYGQQILSSQMVTESIDFKRNLDVVTLIDIFIGDTKKSMRVPTQIT